MKHLRRRRGLGAVVAAVFAVWIGAPRKAFLYHQHPGGEHHHVHADGDDASMGALLDELSARHHHHHGHDHHHCSGTTHARGCRGDHQHPVLYGSDEHGAGHWHQQHPAYRAVVTAVPRILVVAPLEALSLSGPLARARLAAQQRRARGPPVFVFST